MTLVAALSDLLDFLPDGWVDATVDLRVLEAPQPHQLAAPRDAPPGQSVAGERIAAAQADSTRAAVAAILAPVGAAQSGRNFRLRLTPDGMVATLGVVFRQLDGARVRGELVLIDVTAPDVESLARWRPPASLRHQQPHARIERVSGADEPARYSLR